MVPSSGAHWGGGPGGEGGEGSDELYLKSSTPHLADGEKHVLDSDKDIWRIEPDCLTHYTFDISLTQVIDGSSQRYFGKSSKLQSQPSHIFKIT